MIFLNQSCTCSLKETIFVASSTFAVNWPPPLWILMIQQDIYQCDNFGIISNHWSHLIFMPHQDRLSIINIFLLIKRNTWNSTFWSTILSNSFWSKNECLPKLKTGWNIAVLELLQTILTLLIGLIRLIWINVKLPKRKWCSYTK